MNERTLKFSVNMPAVLSLLDNNSYYCTITVIDTGCCRGTKLPFAVIV